MGFSPKILEAMRPQPQQMQIATPFNDTQLIALIAAQLWRLGPINQNKQDPAELARFAVSDATEIVAQAIVQHESLTKRVLELRKEAE